MVLVRQQNQGQQIKFLLQQPEILLQQPNVLLMVLNILSLKQNVFAIPMFTNDFVSIAKLFFPCTVKTEHLLSGVLFWAWI